MIEATLRLMLPEDIPAGMRLCEIAGWNQNVADWKRFLELEPEGCFVACLGARVCGTVTTLRYENCFGWVGMVLTDPEVRRQGIGRRLLDHGIAALERAGAETVKLDATPMGRPVYLPRGFVDEYGIERWEGVPSPRAAPLLAPMTAQDLDRVAGWDREVFGAYRGGLLSCLFSEGPNYSAAVYRGREVAGYVLGRAGRRAHYLGPWVAEDAEIASRLADAFLGRLAGERVYVDVCLVNPHARSRIESEGFTFQRPLTRMYRGPNRHPGQPQLVWGIAGPELG